MAGILWQKYTRKPVVGFAGRPCQRSLWSQERACMLSNKALEEFKQIWREEKGEEISDDFAIAVATNLLTGMNAVFRPLKKEWVVKNSYGK